MHIVMLNGTQQIGQLVLIKTYCCSQTDKCLTFPFPSFLLPDSVNLTNNEIQTNVCSMIWISFSLFVSNFAILFRFFAFNVKQQNTTKFRLSELSSFFLRPTNISNPILN